MAEIRESVVLEVGTAGAVSESSKLTQVFERLVTVLDRVERQLEETTAETTGLARAETVVGTQATRATAALDRQRRSLAASAAAAGSFLAPMGRIAAVLGAGLGVRAAVQQLAELDRQLTVLGAVSGSTSEQLDRVRREAIRIGESSPLSGGQVLGGAVELARAGFQAEEIVASLGTVSGLAVTQQLELAQAAGIVGTALKQFSLPANDAVRVTDALTVGANSANTNVQDLAAGLSYAGPLAAAYGQELESVIAALAGIADSGVAASRAGTGLAGVITGLAQPSSEAAAEFDRVSRSIAALDPRKRTLEEIAAGLADAKAAGADLAKVFEREAQPAAFGLANLAAKVAEVGVRTRESVDIVGDLGGAYRADLAGALAEVGAALEAVITKAGDDGLTGALRTGAISAADIVRELAGVDRAASGAGRSVELIASAVEGLAVAAAVGGVVRLTASLAALANPVTAVAVGLGSLAAGARFVARDLEQVALGTERLSEQAERFAQVRELLDSRTPFAGEKTAAEERKAIEETLRGARAIQSFLDSATETTRFPTFDSLSTAIRKVEVDLRAAETALQALNAGLIADAPVTRATIEGQAADARKRFESLVSQRLEGGAEQFIRADLVPQDLLDQLGIGPQFESALKAASDALGSTGTGFVRTRDLAVLLGEGIDRLEGKLVKFRTSAAAGAAGAAAVADDFEALLAALQASQDVAEDQLKLQAQAAAGDDRAAASLADLIRQQEIAAASTEILTALHRDGTDVTEAQAAAIEALAERYINASAAARALAEQEVKRRDAQRQLERDASRADQLLTSLNLEAASYTNTRDAVERLALEEELRHLQVTEQTKERIRLTQSEIEKRRQLMEIGAGVAGGFTDGIRALAQTGDFREAGATALQGASTRVFESSLARIEEAIATSFVDMVSTPTIGETQIEVATRAVEVAVLQTGAQVAQAIAQGAATSKALSVGAGFTGGAAGNVASPGDPGFVGPPTAESQSGGSGIGGALAGAGIGLALGMVASRLGRDSERQDPRGGEVGFDVLGAAGRNVVNDYRRTTNYISPNPRSQPKNRRQASRDRFLGR
jgi:TP901 family phage tail tape measure protein